MNRYTTWSLIKKIVLYFICASIAVILCFIIVLLYNIHKISQRPYHVTSDTISVNWTEPHNNNGNQNNAEVVIFPADGTLYYLIKSWENSLGLRSQFSDKLCTIENGSIKILQEASLFYGNDNRFIYYEFDDQLMAYDIQSDKASMLTQLNEYDRYGVVLQSDGSLTFFVKDKYIECFSVKDGKLLESKERLTFPLQRFLGENGYYVKWRTVYCQGEDITDRFGRASFRSIVPYQDGLLLINDGYGNLLYYIQEDGEILNLFPEFTCFSSESSINFYDHYIFVSFMRWEGYDESGIGIKRMENDQLAGTYRIDIRDFSVEKISDNIYSGMYIFDDSGIYTCNRDGDISKISFTGEELMKIVY